MGGGVVAFLNAQLFSFFSFGTLRAPYHDVLAQISL